MIIVLYNYPLHNVMFNIITTMIMTLGCDDCICNLVKVNINYDYTVLNIK